MTAEDQAQRRRVSILNALPLLALVCVAVVVTALAVHPVLVGALFAAILVPVVAARILNSGQRRGEQVVEIGTVYLAVVAVYTIYPLLSFVMTGYSYTPLSDSRLFAAQPTPGQIASIGWCYVLYSAAFAASYIAVRRRVPALRVEGLVLERSLVIAVVLLLVLVRLTLFALTWIYGSKGGDTYYDEYLRFAAAPQIVKQVAGHLQGIVYVLQVAVVLVLIGRYAKLKWVLLAWIAAEALTLVVGLGARSQLAVLILASAVGYSWLVRPIPASRLLLFGAAGIVVFVIFGIARAGGLQTLAEGALLASGEFEAVFANAFEVSALKDSGQTEGLAVATYLGDFLSVIPQQLLPFAKTNLTQWYLETFYFEVAQQGGGFAFGTIAESFAGFGVVDIVWRALLLGALFGFLHRYAVENASRFWVILFCLWITVFSYLCFRVSTFTPVARIAYQFVPAYLSITLVMVILRSISGKIRAGSHADADARPVVR